MAILGLHWGPFCGMQSASPIPGNKESMVLYSHSTSYSSIRVLTYIRMVLTVIGTIPCLSLFL